MSSNLKKLFSSRYLYQMILGLTIQQVLVALSTFFIANAAKTIQDPKLFLLYLAGYCTTLILPYIPGGWALIKLNRWSLEAQSRFAESVTFNLFSNPHLWPVEKEKNRYTSSFSKEGPVLIDDFTRFVYRGVSLVLNAILAIVVISVTVEPLFIASYLISAFAGHFLMKSGTKSITPLSEQAEISKYPVTVLRGKLWDNLVIGNTHSMEKWRKHLDSAFEDFSRNEINLTRKSQFSSIGVAFVSMIPTLVLVIWIAIQHFNDSAYLMGLLVILPRMFQLLNSTYDYLNLGLEWGTIKGRLTLLQTILVRPDQKEANPMKFQELRLKSSDGYHGIKDLANVNTLLEKHRYLTLSGPNGSGKSTLCLSIKEKMGNSCFLLPTHHNLSFKSQDGYAGSTGQKLMQILEEIKNDVKVKVLILDEWDANLDDENCHRILKTIDQLNQTGIQILDVRH
jgi:ABC-type multidrug transport system fused ATPase/permease subunit